MQPGCVAAIVGVAAGVLAAHSWGGVTHSMLQPQIAASVLVASLLTLVKPLSEEFEFTYWCVVRTSWAVVCMHERLHCCRVLACSLWLVAATNVSARFFWQGTGE